MNIFKFYTFIFAGCMLLATSTKANKGNDSVTAVFRSRPVDSLFNFIEKTDGCQITSPAKNSVNENKTYEYELTVSAWTANHLQCNYLWHRSVLSFAQLSTIPANAIVKSATLQLFGLQAPTNVVSVGNSYYPGSPYYSHGTNEVVIKRIKDPWKRNTITWNNQPSTDSLHTVVIPFSTSQYGYNVMVNVTQMVQDMVSQNQPYGFLFTVQNDTFYRNMGFHTPFATDSNKRPVLNITYLVGTGIDETNTTYIQGIYPQPAHDHVSIHYMSSQACVTTYQVYDIRGAQILQGNTETKAGDNTLQLDINKLVPGVYLLEMKYGTSLLRNKLVVQ